MNILEKQFVDLFEHKMNDAQMESFIKGSILSESTTPEEIAIAAEVMRRYAKTLEVDASIKPKMIDIVGTGGDKSGSFNISTTAALVVSACGCYVAKHGNRSITSKSGSADVLENLGIRLDLSIEQSKTLLEETGFTFMFAQSHHPAMKFIMPIRKKIGEKTVFNLLGPLTNPAGVEKFLIGVFDKTFVKKVAESLRLNNIKSAYVVSSKDGMDEICTSDITYACALKDEKLHEFEIDPEAYGLKKVPFEALHGGDATENAKILKAVLMNSSTDAQRDVVLINCAYALLAEGMARDVQEGIEMAKSAIKSNKAHDKLMNIIEVSSKL